MINFPNNPTDNQQYSFDGRSWKYSVAKHAWVLIPIASSDVARAEAAAATATAAATLAQNVTASLGQLDSTAAAAASAAAASATAAANSAASAAANAVDNVLAKPLTGLSTSTGGAVVATDTVLQGIGKLQAEISALPSNITLTKASVGLGNVQNLAPADLPLSTASTAAIATVNAAIAAVSSRVLLLEGIANIVPKDTTPPPIVTPTTYPNIVPLVSGGYPFTDLSSRRLYGPGRFVMDGLWNMDVVRRNGYDYQVALRFQAEYSGYLNSIVLYNSDGPGYAGGNGGQLRLDVVAENNAVPASNSAILSTGTHTPASVPGGMTNGQYGQGAQRFAEIPLVATVALVKGQYYYVLATNIDSNPAVNWSSIDCAYLIKPNGQPGRWNSRRSWGTLLGRKSAGVNTAFDYTWSNGDADNALWTDNGHGSGVGTVIMPLMQLTYQTGERQGEFSMESGNNGSKPWENGAANPFRERFRPTVQRKFTGFAFMTGKVSGTGGLAWKIKQGSTVMASGTIADPGTTITSNSDINPTTRILTWFDVDLQATLTWAANTDYDVEFTPVGNSVWCFVTERNGSDYGISYPSAFTESEAWDFYNGSWKKAYFWDKTVDQGGSNLRITMYQDGASIPTDGSQLPVNPNPTTPINTSVIDLGNTDFMGDSLTRGDLVSSVVYYSPVDKTIALLVAGNYTLSAVGAANLAVPGNWPVTAQGGWTMADMATKFTQLAALKPQTLIIHIGTNDAIAQTANIDTATTNFLISAVATQAQAAGVKRLIVIGARKPDWFDTPSAAALTALKNAASAYCAANTANRLYIDLEGAGLTSADTVDGTHFNNPAANKVAAYTVSQIDTWLRQTTSGATATEITGPGQVLVADDGAQWTITTDRIALRNGLVADNNADVDRVVKYNGVIYDRNISSGNWWSWNGTNWVYYGTTSPVPVNTTPPPSTGGTTAASSTLAELINQQIAHEVLPYAANISQTYIQRPFKITEQTVGVDNFSLIGSALLPDWFNPTNKSTLLNTWFVDMHAWWVVCAQRTGDSTSLYTLPSAAVELSDIQLLVWRGGLNWDINPTGSTDWVGSYGNDFTSFIDGASWKSTGTSMIVRPGNGGLQVPHGGGGGIGNIPNPSGVRGIVLRVKFRLVDWNTGQPIDATGGAKLALYTGCDLLPAGGGANYSFPPYNYAPGAGSGAFIEARSNWRYATFSSLTATQLQGAKPPGYSL